MASERRVRIDILLPCMPSIEMSLFPCANFVHVCFMCVSHDPLLAVKGGREVL